jgi:uncharacterized protein
MVTPFKMNARGVSVAIRLTPAARRAGIFGWMDAGDGASALKVSVNAPPEDGKANDALLDLLAQAWNLPKKSLSLLSGAAHRRKVVLIETDEGAALMQRLIQHSGAG